MLKELKAKRYLGDGVYAGFDGYHIVLWVEGGSAFGDNAIALETMTFEALLRYKKDLEVLPIYDVPEMI